MPGRMSASTAAPAGVSDRLRWRRGNTRIETLWFAPALGFWVRREWSGEYLRQGERREREVEDWVRFELVTA